MGQLTFHRVTPLSYTSPDVLGMRSIQLQGGEHPFERCFPLGVEDPCREHPAIHPPPVQQLEQFARTQGGAAGGVQVTMNRGEEQAYGIPGRKAVMRSIDGVDSGSTNPLRSRSCRQERPPSGDTRKSRSILP